MKLSDYTHDLEGKTLFVTFNNRPQHWQQHEYVVVGSRAARVGARNYWCSVQGSFEQQEVALWKSWTVAYSVLGKITEENVGFKGRKAAIEYSTAFDEDEATFQFISCTARNLA